MAHGTRATFQALLHDLQTSLQGSFAQLSGTDERLPRGPVQHTLLIELELLSKIHEQLVLPALADAAPGASHPIANELNAIDWMRNVTVLVKTSAPANRDLALAVLEGLAMLHFEGVNALVAGAAGERVDWAAIDAEARSWLRRWRAELRADGEIEDEDGDPVGAPVH